MIVLGPFVRFTCLVAGGVSLVLVLATLLISHHYQTKEVSAAYTRGYFDGVIAMRTNTVGP